VTFALVVDRGRAGAIRADRRTPPVRRSGNGGPDRPSAPSSAGGRQTGWDRPAVGGHPCPPSRRHPAAARRAAAVVPPGGRPEGPGTAGRWTGIRSSFRSPIFIRSAGGRP